MNKLEGYVKLASILICVLLTNFILLVIVPIFPIVAYRRGISQTEISVLFTASQFSSFISCFWVSRIISSIGNRYTAILGLLAGSLSMLGMSLGYYLSNTLFLYVSIGSRVIGGFGVSCIYIASFGMILNEFPEKRDKYNSLMEAFGGMGLMLGPLYCSLVHDFLGFSDQLLYTCIVVLIFTLIYWYGTRNRSKMNSEKKNSELGLMMKFNRNLAIDFSMLVYGYIVLCYLEPTLGLYLFENGVDETTIGLIFSAITLFYCLTNFLMSWLGNFMKLEKMMYLGVLTSTTVLIIIAPIASMFNLISLTLISVSFVGAGLGIGFSCTMPAMIKEIKLSEFDDKGKLYELNSVYAMGLNVGEIIGPLISSLISERFGFVISSIFVISIGVFILSSHFCLRKQIQPYEEPLLGVRN